jgi:hypothetical protein
MDENDITKFRAGAIAYFEPILFNDGYPLAKAQELAFFTSKILEDSLSLIEDIKRNEDDIEKILRDIHVLFTNSYAFQEGNKILMWEERK